jgi:hypothetical protein
LIISMGWNCGSIFIEAPADRVLAALAEYERKPEDIDLESAIDEARDNVNGVASIGQVGPWTVLWQRSALYDPALARVATSSRLLAVLLNSLEPVYGFDWVVNGELVRRIVHSGTRGVLASVGARFSDARPMVKYG